MTAPDPKTISPALEKARAKANTSRNRFADVVFEGITYRVKCPTVGEIEDFAEKAQKSKGSDSLLQLLTQQVVAVDETGHECGRIWESNGVAVLKAMDPKDPLIKSLSEALAGLMNVAEQQEAAKKA